MKISILEGRNHFSILTVSYWTTKWIIGKLIFYTSN